MMKNRFQIWCAATLLFLVSLVVHGQHQLPVENEEITPLEAGKSIEREIAPRQRHRYKLTLEADKYVKIEVLEKGCDVVMSFRSPEGTNLLEFADVQSSNGVKSIWAAVGAAGDYELRVLSYGEIDGSGTYSVKIGELRPATEKELNFTAGVKLYNEAFNAVNPGMFTAKSLQQSIAKGFEAVEKYHAATAVKQEARALWQIATVYSLLNNKSKAVDFYTQALQKFHEAQDQGGEANTFRDLGRTYIESGKFEEGIDALSQALTLARQSKKEMTEADSLNSLGEVYARFGNYERASLYYNQSSEIYFQQSNISQSIPINNLGKMAWFSGDKQKALDYFRQALEIMRKEKNRFGTKKAQETSVLNNIGKTYFSLGNREKALESFNESLTISRELDDKLLIAKTLRNLGQVYLLSNEPEKALEFFNQAAEIFRAIEDYPNLGETLLASAKTNALKNDLPAAQNQTEQAIKLIEQIRARLQTAELRDSFSADLQDYYGFYVEILMRREKAEPNKGFAALALQASERARARGLLNLLAESNANIREGADAKLLAKETDLRNLLSARQENLTRVLSGKHTAEQAEKLKLEAEQIRLEYEQTQSEIRQSSPRYAALTQPKILSLTEIQQQVLDENSVLLEYSLGDTKSFLWIVTKTDFQAVELPKKAEIETLARTFYENLTARNKRIKFATPEENAARIAKADTDFQENSRLLGEKILAPALKFISKKRLLVVSEGALQYVPFAALKNPFAPTNYLVESNEIVNLPSASALAVLRAEFKERKPAAKTLAIFADPVFDTDDERFKTLANKNKQTPKIEQVAALKNKETAPTRNLTRTMSDFGEEGFSLPRLTFTRREANSISALLPPNQRKEVLDFGANRGAVLDAEISNYRFVHFATHSFVNDKNPELSGIVFSLIDENGKELDGFLRVGDVFNLKIPAELVVLSGCKTGLGKEIKGEGLVGLTRGFMYAGAKRVAVSFWDVNDEATSVLMTHFYQKILGKEKLSPTSALREAQISLIKDKNWQNPYYWAAFTLQGEPQ